MQPSCCSSKFLKFVYLQSFFVIRYVHQPAAKRKINFEIRKRYAKKAGCRDYLRSTRCTDTKKVQVVAFILVHVADTIIRFISF